RRHARLSFLGGDFPRRLPLLRPSGRVRAVRPAVTWHSGRMDTTDAQWGPGVPGAACQTEDVSQAGNGLAIIQASPAIERRGAEKVHQRLPQCARGKVE